MCACTCACACVSLPHPFPPRASHTVLATQRARASRKPTARSRSNARRLFKDGDTVRVTQGRPRGHVGVVQSYAGGKYTVRLQDGSECSYDNHYFERTSLRCVCDLSLSVFTPCGGRCACGDSVGPESHTNTCRHFVVTAQVSRWRYCASHTGATPWPRGRRTVVC